MHEVVTMTSLRGQDLLRALRALRKGDFSVRLPVDHAKRIHAAKNFLVAVEGPDELVAWFMQLLNMILTAGTRFGTPLPEA